MLQKLSGAGLPNVYLRNGFEKSGIDDGETIAYHSLDRLYVAIARSICLRTTPLQPAEVRFLRRRLQVSQEEIGAMCGKSSQAVAKWEKGQAVPIADGNLIRLAWLAKFSKKDLVQAVHQMSSEPNEVDGGDYVMEFDGADWFEDRAHVVQMALQLAAEAVQDIRATAYNTADLASFSIQAVPIDEENEALA